MMYIYIHAYTPDRPYASHQALSVTQGLDQVLSAVTWVYISMYTTGAHVCRHRSAIDKSN